MSDEIDLGKTKKEDLYKFYVIYKDKCKRLESELSDTKRELRIVSDLANKFELSLKNILFSMKSFIAAEGFNEPEYDSHDSYFMPPAEDIKCETKPREILFNEYLAEEIKKVLK